MPQKIPVSALYRFCKIMLRDHWGYIWGTAGIRWTEDRQKATDNEMARKYGDRWIGHVVADCSGVMVYIWRQYGLKIAHGSNSIKRQYMGKLQTMPKPGYGALKLRNGDDYYHIGIVSEDGTHVYESKGTLFGFVVSDVKEWDWFGPFKDVDYSEEVKPVEKALYQARVTTDGGILRLREEPSTKSEILAKLQNGSIVDVFGTIDDWASVVYNGIEGYCSSHYLTKIETSEHSGKWAVIVPCESKEEAEMLASFLNGSIVAEQDGD